MIHEYRKLTVKAPSNIAFIKYWGKFGRQYPMNPSISMTLKECTTKFEVEYRVKENNSNTIVEFAFENKENTHFKNKIETYLHSIVDIYPLSNKLQFKIKSSNSFPHSAGIASSASSMCALGTSLAYIERKFNQNLEVNFNNRASTLARLASGSASRSISGPFMIWGENDFSKSSNEYASDFTQAHSMFKNLCDSILIVSAKKKTTSSTAGHSMMNGHFYMEARKNQAFENFRSLITAMKIGDFESFGEIIETEALSLHALMMSSQPSYLLLKPNSLLLIDEIRKIRSELQLPIYFTIDAGPNIHLIYPNEYQEKVLSIIKMRLNQFCENIIHDTAGVGTEIYD